jgi:uncharacterized protein with HEPN domain
MQPDCADAALLLDMLNAAQEVAQMVQGIPYEDYMLDRVRQLAVERAIEVIGEAARSVSDAFRRAHPEIPWNVIVGQRHVLAHDYGRIDHERLWRVVTIRVPELIALLQPLIPPLPPPIEE